MKKILFLILMTVLVSINVFAQTTDKKTNLAKFNISGTWVLDKEASIFSYNRDINTQEKEGFEDYILKITQKELEIQITKIFTFKGRESNHTTTLFTDKRGEKNNYSYPMESFGDYKTVVVLLKEANVESKSFWKNGKLIRSGTFNGEIGGSPYKRESGYIVKEIYTLSDDAKTLIIQTDLQILHSATNIELQKLKLVFQKKEG